jgi:integrase
MALRWQTDGTLSTGDGDRFGDRSEAKWTQLRGTKRLPRAGSGLRSRASAAVRLNGVLDSAGGGRFRVRLAIAVMARRSRGTGHLYEKHGSYYGRWRTSAGRLLNRRVGPIRTAGSRSGLTRSQAERLFQRMQDEEERRPQPARDQPIRTVRDAGDSLRRRLKLEGARRSYLQNCESMQRIHIEPRLGGEPFERVTTAQVEALADSMLASGLSPKTVRNVLSFLHSVFEEAKRRGWAHDNPVQAAAKPRRRRQGDANPDLQFLTVHQLGSVIAAIPDGVVRLLPKPTRRGRRGPAPPPPPDVLGSVLRVIVLAAAITGLRQSELLGLRWRDVDFDARRIRVRNAYVRGEHSAEGKSDLSTRRSVPIADVLTAQLLRWRGRSVFTDVDDLVFAHPQTGHPLDRSKVTRRFQRACRDAGVSVITFHDLRHTSRRSSQRKGSRCASSRSSSDTQMRRRRRSTRTTRRRSASSRWSTTCSAPSTSAGNKTGNKPRRSQRNPGVLERSCRARSPPTGTGARGLGAGRSQVQFLFPRYEVPGDTDVLGRGALARGVQRVQTGRKSRKEARSGVSRRRVDRAALVAPGSGEPIRPRPLVDGACSRRKVQCCSPRSAARPSTLAALRSRQGTVRSTESSTPRTDPPLVRSSVTPWPRPPAPRALRCGRRPARASGSARVARRRGPRRC